MNDYTNFLKTEMAKVLAERDAIKEQREKALRIIAEKSRELEFIKRENKVLKERFDEAIKQLGAKRLSAMPIRRDDDTPAFLPLGSANKIARAR